MLRSSRRRTIALAALGAGMVLAQAPASVLDGVYSDVQANRGALLYQQQCASCHGDKLQGKGQAPPLTGMDFVSDWTGMTLGDLFDKMQVSMPGDRPGSLTREQNGTVLAYILSTNKFPSGAEDLATDADRLRRIRFEPSRSK